MGKRDNAIRRNAAFGLWAPLGAALSLCWAGWPAAYAAPPQSATAPTAGAPHLPATLDGVQLNLTNVETRIREIDGVLRNRSKGPTGPGLDEDLAARRLTDAQVLYTFKNYEAAATILFDVVDRYQKTTVYPEALFYLGDSLYLRHDYLSSLRYFEKLADGFPQHPRYQEALVRLLEISFHLRPGLDDRGPSAQAEKWVDRLAQVPRDKVLAQVPYVRGKYHFFKKEYDKALAVLQPILPASAYAFQAHYFIGASHVAKGSLQEAVADFAIFDQMAAHTDPERRIAELAHMALGRIYYEQGQTTKAQEEYLHISQKSDLFPDALYEAAWVSIKAKEYKRAERSLELLVLAQPDALNAPESKLLIGNLQTRLSEFQPATQWFLKTRDEFDPVNKSLNEILTQNGDPGAYFRALIEKNLGPFDVATSVGKTAARFLRGEPEVERFFTLSGDVAELRRSLDEVEDTIRRVEKAFSGKQRYNIDPELGAARESCLHLADELLFARRDLAEMLLSTVTLAASVEERQQLVGMAHKREGLSREFLRQLAAPTAESRAEQRRAEINDIDKRASELQVQLVSLRKQREAIEQYYAQTRTQQKIAPQQFQHDLTQVTAEEDRVQKEYDQIRRDLGDTMNGVGVGDEESQAGAEKTLRQDYLQAVERETVLLDQLRLRLTGGERARADAIWAALSRTAGTEQQLQAVTGTVNQLFGAKLAEMQATLLTEKENARGYRRVLDGYTGETQGVGGDVLGDALRSTARRFYDIVVRADVGVLDVAWALKQERTEQVSRLVREQKREMKLLDDEFKEVLKKE